MIIIEIWMENNQPIFWKIWTSLEEFTIFMGLEFLVTTSLEKKVLPHSYLQI
jgi:hypothetical protein